MQATITVLIADDDRYSRETLAALLRGEGHRLVLADNGLDAFELAGSCNPDVVLLDVMMPGIDGFEVCRRLRADPQLAELPVIMVTALDDRESRLRGIEVGADDFISKPPDRRELQLRVRTIARLNRYRRLVAEREKFERVVQLSPNGLMIVDASGVIQLINPAMLHMLAADAANLALGQSIGAFIAPDLREVCLQHVDVVGRDPARVERFECMLIGLSGQSIAVEIDAGHIVWEWNPAVQIVVRDISERKQAEALAHRQLERLAALRTIDRSIAANLDLSVTLNVILDQLTNQLDVDAAAILLRQSHTHIFEYSAIRGLDCGALRQSTVRLGVGCAGHVALHRQMLYLPQGHGAGTPDLVLPCPGYTAYCGIPLIAKGQVEGVLEVFHRTVLDRDAAWFDFLETIAGQAAVAIDHAALFHSLQRSNVDLALAYDATLEGWARALELRDRETEGHSQRVAEITVRMARLMGLSGADLTYIRWGALLHDIGKMGIPDSILLKPGPLTDDEWEVMRRHPTYGYELLSPIAYLRPALDIPYCHHERWDGTGYPRGLKGEQIPLAARLFAVVDVWDALRSDRPYRPSFSEAQTYEHIAQLAGSHLDPQVVDVFLNQYLVDYEQRRPAVLIVDDEETIVTILARDLSEQFSVFTATTGTEALEILAREEIAVIITDQRMPGLTGVQLLERARHIRPTALGILSSAYFDTSALIEALNLGTVRGFVPKPWNLAELRQRVNEVVQQYQELRATNAPG